MEKLHLSKNCYLCHADKEAEHASARLIQESEPLQELLVHRVDVEQTFDVAIERGVENTFCETYA